DTAPQQVTRISRQKYQMPEPNRRTWPDVRNHLIRKLKFQPDFIDQAHENGLIFSDQRSNIVFPRADNSGVFKIGAGDKPFNQSLGKDGGPFVMPGTNNKAYIVESPMEALNLKAMTPDSTIIATNGFMQPDKLKPYLDQKEVLITQGQSATSGEMVRYLCAHLPNATRVQPKLGKTWHECRLLQIEEAEKERKQAQAAAREQAKAQAHAPAQTQAQSPSPTRSTGMSR
ncbi:hypothetical protein LJB86_02345, partial [Deltaproteobacteria bacterium OttesenSCG-928-M10]|nr:hypothetical protein [Deltaproteobacteria bacterium OttesenSCG-928-M10]